jgi:hypothetical protein
VCQIFSDTVPTQVQSELTGNAGTDGLPEPIPGNEAPVTCCDLFNDVLDGADANPNNLASYFLGSLADCWPEELPPIEEVTCGHYYGLFLSGEDAGCANSVIMATLSDARSHEVWFFKNPDDGHIWIAVRQAFQVEYGPTFPFPGDETAEGAAYGFLDTGETSLASTDGPWTVNMIDPDTCPGWLRSSCWNLTPGSAEVTLL